MTNALLIEDNGAQSIVVETREEHESDANGQIEIEKMPTGTLFIYDAESGEKITGWSYSNKKIYLGQAYKNVVVDY